MQVKPFDPSLKSYLQRREVADIIRPKAPSIQTPVQYIGMPNYSISPERKAAFYIGLAITGLGFLLFISTFFFIASLAGQRPDVNNFGQQASSGMMGITVRALGGMALMTIGPIIAIIGKLGPAGSGVILDPRQARKDVEPWSRMVGGVVNDALEEIQPAKPTNRNSRLTILRDLLTEEPPAPVGDRPAVERLSEIKTLLDKGMLNPEEYEAKRKAIIDSI